MLDSFGRRDKDCDESIRLDRGKVMSNDADKIGLTWYARVMLENQQIAAELDQLRADAELGRLVRQLPKYWCVGLYDGGWWVIDESVRCDTGGRNVAVADTPEEALRMAMEGMDD